MKRLVTPVLWIGLGVALGAQQPPSSSDSLRWRPKTLPVLVASCAPHYTQEALKAGISGRVVLRVRIGADGTVERAIVAKSLDKVYGLDEQAMFTVGKFVFKPATIAGVPAPFDDANIEVNFDQVAGRPIHEGGCKAVGAN
jgi:TonB family protein